MKKNNNGFTLIELLFVVAIISILMTIVLPILNTAFEKSRQATDLANMRSAKSAALIDYLTNEYSEEVIYYFDAQSGRISTTERPEKGYGKSEKNVLDFDTILENSTGYPNKNGRANYVTVTVTPNHQVFIAWGNGVSFHTIDGGTLFNNNFSNGQNQYVKDAKQQLLNVDNQSRINNDQEVLNRLAQYLNNLDMNSEEAEKIFGNIRLQNIRSGRETTMFEYQVDKNGVVRLSNFDTSYQPYFTSIGYSPTYVSNTPGLILNPLNYRSDTTLGTGSRDYNYVNQYLFTSDTFIGGSMSNGASNQIKITYKNGKVVLKAGGLTSE